MGAGSPSGPWLRQGARPRCPGPRLQGITVDHVLDDPEILAIRVRDLDAELLLERVGQLDQIQAIGTQVVEKARAGSNLMLFYIELVANEALTLKASTLTEVFRDLFGIPLLTRECCHPR